MKKEQILNYLIETYLTELSPISSGELKKRCELSFSPSTIRNYFQKLDNDGMIMKVHISSGSIPSVEALQKYWYENLDFENIKISKSLLEKSAREFDVFISFKKKQNLVLELVLNINDEFIILDFLKEEIILRYSNELFNLFNELKGYSLENIQKTLSILKIHIGNKFHLQRVTNFNREFLYKHYQEFLIDNMFNEQIFEEFNKGLSFNKNYLVYNLDTIIDDKKNELIILGDIYTNYLNFFNSIKEAK